MKKNCTNKLLAVITALVMLLTMTGLAVTANAAAYDIATQPPSSFPTMRLP